MNFRQLFLLSYMDSLEELLKKQNQVKQYPKKTPLKEQIIRFSSASSSLPSRSRNSNWSLLSHRVCCVLCWCVWRVLCIVGKLKLLSQRASDRADVEKETARSDNGICSCLC